MGRRPALAGCRAEVDAGDDPRAAAERPAATPACGARGDKGERSGAGVFAPLAPAVAAIHRRLKAGFDPSGIFNPGRMYPDL